ncbi:MAG: GntR family transcriptional regulator [Anaerolineales bacterium]|nr:GntR family transcriptional regulator [Anaerolineales bacterium]
MNDNFSDITHQQLYEKVSDHLRTAILNGEIRPGEWIRQKRIAEELGVSQMPVREALKELASEGLVEHVPYRGVRVVRLSGDDIADLYAQRACLESRATRAAAEKITAEELQNLRDLQKQLEANLAPENLQTYRDLNRQFHQIIYYSSGRDYLIRTLDQMWSAFPTMLFSNFSQTSNQPITTRDQSDIHEHLAILAALEARDPERAEKAMFEHIQSASKAFQTIIAE